MEDREKIRVLLSHWIEHNAEHAREFLKWAEKASEVAEELRRAAQYMEEAGRALEAALGKLGRR
ncbi:MAG TPA: hypothetical protein EYP17_06095 [Candidatus Latescibacteria bacterium]|nr:hypothetical protein [Candidatus Latescibacterota bacterium]